MSDEPMTCRFCGADAPVEARRCPSCGKRLAAVRAVTPADEVAEEVPAPGAPDAAEPEAADPEAADADQIVLPEFGCYQCFREPAADVELRSNTGLVLGRRYSLVEGRFCRDCGLALYRKHMNHTLLLGWWGIISFFTNFAAIFKNIKGWGVIRSLDAPSGQAEQPPLEPGRPMYARPGIYMAAALVLAGVLFLGNAGGDEAKAFDGKCIKIDNDGERVKQVDCDGKEDGKVVGIVKDKKLCPEGTDGTLKIKADDDNTICVDIDQ